MPVNGGQRVTAGGTPENTIADVAQLVEHNLAKVGVASSSLVVRSIIKMAL